MLTNWLPLSGVDKLGFQSKAQVSPSLSHPIVWLVRHLCSYKAEFLFCKRRPLFDALPNLYQTDVWSIRYTRDHSHCTE